MFSVSSLLATEGGIRPHEQLYQLPEALFKPAERLEEVCLLILPLIGNASLYFFNTEIVTASAGKYAMFLDERDLSLR